MDLEKRYQEKFGYCDTFKSLGWNSKQSQQIRFFILIGMTGIEFDDTFLDVGCGYGDFSNMVENYFGIDVRLSAIEKAIEKYGNKFKNCTIDDISQNYDWVVASGVFSLKEENWLEKTTHTINKMFSLCSKGIALNFLSELSDSPRLHSDILHVKIEDVIPIITRMSNSFVIRHDYLFNDFTIYIYKIRL